MFGKYSKQNLW